MRPCCRRRRAGVSLLELSAIVAIIGVLAAILLPALSRARESARRTSCASQLCQLGMCLRMYADENSGRLPWSGGHNDAKCLRYAITDYIEDVGVFTCPSDAEHQPVNRASSRGEPSLGITNAAINQENSCRMSYDYFGAYTTEPITLPPPQYAIPRIPVMWDHVIRGDNTPGAYSSPVFNHIPGGGNVLSLDGSVEFVRVMDWQSDGVPFKPEAVGYEAPAYFFRDIRPEDAAFFAPRPMAAPGPYPPTTPPSGPSAAPPGGPPSPSRVGESPQPEPAPAQEPLEPLEAAPATL